ncbi:hypothetical protein CDAR_8441 [Caerostris darwini]|uniref:Uncharacterized protein n=1 Tax=Caerostris darwini TaxID=1538125 RepID=A0AAV4WTS1_9ARAC|nr:hypothetical protein CDAR_8441 [Caerostris darwini]
MASCPARQISVIKCRQSMSEDEASFTCDYSRLPLVESVFSMAYRGPPKSQGQKEIELQRNQSPSTATAHGLQVYRRRISCRGKFVHINCVHITYVKLRFDSLNRRI